MSEYHFSYKCSSMVDASNKKALRFSLFQNYNYKNPNSPMQVMVYIPKSLQKNLAKIHLYYQENGVDFPDLEKDRHQMIEASDVAKTNAIFIEPASNCSGTGIIALIRKGEEKAKLEDTYRFTINYLKKQPIYYEINEKERKLDIKVVYPRILHSIDLMICFENKRKPLFIKEYQDPNHQLRKENSVVRLTLPVKQSDVNYEHFVVPVEKTNGPDYRLTFLDKEGENNFDLYTLVDESEVTIEERERNRRYYEEPKRTPYKRISTCPHCGGPLVIPPNDRKTHTCDGKELNDPELAGALHGTRVVCQNCYYDHPKVVDGVRFLPQDVFNTPVMHTLFIGAKNSGKTMFLASILNLYGNENEFKSVPDILGAITKGFSHKKNAVASEYVPETYRMDGKKVIKAPHHQRFENQKRYLLEVNHKAEGHTVYDTRDAISWNPQSYKLDGLGYVYFYDVPGEAYEREKELLHSFDMVDSIIAVVDGYPNEDSISPLIALQNCLTKILDFAGDRKEEIKKLPLAVVFTKMDKLLKDHTDKESIENCLDDNCHITKEDMISLFPKNGKYEGSQLQRHINNSSYELVHFINKFPVGEDFTNQLNEFERWKLFSTSALGSNEVLDPDKNVLCKHRTLRVELPLIWLMYQKHLIKK